MINGDILNTETRSGQGVERTSQANKDKERAHRQKYYAKNRNVILKKAANWYRENKDKVKAYRQSDHYKKICKKWRGRSSQEVRNAWLLCRYGITNAEYAAMLKIQGGVCAICKRKERTKNRWGTLNRYLAVDHCYKKKHIRGLLCRTCNSTLGIMKDRVDWFQNAIDYLNKYAALPIPIGAKRVKPWNH